MTVGVVDDLNFVDGLTKDRLGLLIDLLAHSKELDLVPYEVSTIPERWLSEVDDVVVFLAWVVAVLNVEDGFDLDVDLSEEVIVDIEANLRRNGE